MNTDTIEKNSQKYLIFTDGSSRGNPGPGGWAAIVVGGSHVRELGGREDDTTNNRMEITAALRAISSLPAGASATVYTDSTYLAKGASAWLFSWKARGWKTASKDDVLNQDLWQEMDAALAGRTIRWQVVPGHAGHPLNERCDVIATSCADDGGGVELYNGPLAEYDLAADLQALLNGGQIHVSEAALAAKKNKSSSKKDGRPAYSYVSAVGGKVEAHSNWGDCKKRVDGVSGARFKKVFSAAEEAVLKAEWGR